MEYYFRIQNVKIKSFECDAYGYCFALIYSEKDEDLSIIDETFLKQKIDKLSKEGLTSDVVKRKVENFIKAFPLKYTIYKMKAEGLQI